MTHPIKLLRAEKELLQEQLDFDQDAVSKQENPMEFRLRRIRDNKNKIQELDKALKTLRTLPEIEIGKRLADLLWAIAIASLFIIVIILKHHGFI